MDEILTPDSSRFLAIASYQEGSNPASYDKQFLRDWLESVVVDGGRGTSGHRPPVMPLSVVNATAERYRAARALPPRLGDAMDSRLLATLNGQSKQHA